MIKEFSAFHKDWFYARHPAAKLPVREWALAQLVGAQANLAAGYWQLYFVKK